MVVMTRPAVRVLVEVDWPGGSRRYAVEDLAVETTGYDGRLVSVEEITSPSGGARASARFTLENIPTSPESLWSNSNPPENAVVRIYYWWEGDALADRVQVFQGVVEQVSQVTDSQLQVSCFASLEKFDIPIGKGIALADFSDAPPESVGKMQPIIFGTVPEVEGIPTTRIGNTRLAAALLKADTTATVEDTADFPSTGTFVVGTEEVTYTGKTATTFTGLTRATASTVATDYGSGTEVREKGTLDVIFCQHAAGAISSVLAMRGDRVKPLVAGTDYTATLTAPAKVALSAGWPKLAVPGGSTEFMQVQTDAAGSNNTADSPEQACADHADWTEREPAVVSDAKDILEVSQDDAVEPPGELLRTWLVVEYDKRDVAAAIADGDQLDVKVTGGSVLGQLSINGNLPSVIKQRQGLGLARAYDDMHSHQSSATELTQSSITPSAKGSTGSAFWTNRNNSHDDDPATKATTTTILAPGINFNGWGEAITASRTLVKFRAGARVHDTGQPGKFAVQIIINPTSVDVGGTIVATGYSNEQEAQEDVVTPWYVTSDWAILTGCVLRLNTLNSVTDSFAVWEVYLEAVYTTTGAETSDILALEHTRAQLFEITGAGAQQVDAWADFVGLKAQVIYTGTSSLLVRIVRVYYLVEFVPFRYEPATRILATVQGLVTDGDAVDILAQVMTHSMLGNQAASAYDAASFAAAQASLDALSWRLDGVVRERLLLSELIAKVCEQARLLHHWTATGTLRVVFQPVIASLPAPLRTYREDDLCLGTLVRERETLREVVTVLEVSYAWSDRRASYGGNYRATGSSAAAVGTRQGDRELDLIQNQAVAEAWAAWKVERTARPRYRVTFEGYLPMLDVRPGDVLGLSTNRHTFTKLEVEEVAIDGVRVRVSCTAWD